MNLDLIDEQAQCMVVMSFYKDFLLCDTVFKR